MILNKSKNVCKILEGKNCSYRTIDLLISISSNIDYCGIIV